MPRLIRPSIPAASPSPFMDAQVGFPPGTPGFMMRQTQVFTSRDWSRHAVTGLGDPVTILYDDPTTIKSGELSLPRRPHFSSFETRSMGPLFQAFMRPWYWRGPNQNVQLSVMLHDPSTQAHSPMGVTMIPRSRITRTVNVPKYRSDPNSVDPTQTAGSTIGTHLANTDPMSSKNRGEALLGRGGASSPAQRLFRRG